MFFNRKTPFWTVCESGSKELVELFLEKKDIDFNKFNILADNWLDDVIALSEDKIKRALRTSQWQEKVSPKDTKDTAAADSVHHCPICDKYFDTAGGLVWHNIKVHEYRIPNTNMQCPMCKATFSTESHARRHIVNKSCNKGGKNPRAAYLEGKIPLTKKK